MAVKMETTTERLAKLSGAMSGYARLAYGAMCRHDYVEARVLIERALDAYDTDQRATMKRIRAMALERTEEVE